MWIITFSFKEKACDVRKHYRCLLKERYVFTSMNLTGRHKGHHKLPLLGLKSLKTLSNLTYQDNSGQPD